MTSTAGKADTTQHPDVSEISDLTEGLLPPSRSMVVRRHLEGCPLCDDVRASLEEIRGLLGTLPGPPRMPAEIAGRIDAALAAEALLSATRPENGSAVSRETTRTPVKASPPIPSIPPVDRPGGRPGASTGPGRGIRPRRRRVTLLATIGAAFGAVVLGAGLYLSQAHHPVSNSASGDTKKADVAAGAAHTVFSGSPVEDRVRNLLHETRTAKTPQGVGPGPMSTETDGGTPRQNREATVPGCVLEGTGRTDAVLGQELGEYRGTPAYLLVLTDPADNNRVQAYVIDASCASGSAGGAGSTAARVLFSETYARS
ncbi:hypothetical protein ACIQCR_01880 [Streptomyces sp. NPDC093249]|uniref:hypothetical protein n=1 Tax=unclassified Streptomyces TaxID=2593676 RepID=UPI003450BACC